MINLSIPDDRQKLAQLIQSDIDKYCADKPQRHSRRLPVSKLGKPCDRQLWYGFRHVKLEQFEGRMHRLFNVGHQAEPRFNEYLRGIGFEVKEFDENGEQFGFTSCDGHYGGYCDGKCKAPARYEITEDLIFLNEFKTNGTGAGYAKVANAELSEAKPEHWKQINQYGYKMGLKYGLYLIENKNDSDITVKIVKLDWNVGRECEKRAQDIINSRTPPLRISDNPATFECKFCSTKGICHYNEPVEKNCRSCRNAVPIADGKWNCEKFGLIPDDFIKVGCGEHVSVNGQ